MAPGQAKRPISAPKALTGGGALELTGNGRPPSDGGAYRPGPGRVWATRPTLAEGERMHQRSDQCEAVRVIGVDDVWRPRRQICAVLSWT